MLIFSGVPMTQEPTYEYNRDGKIVSKSYPYCSFKGHSFSWHREDGPAYIRYNGNGDIMYEVFWFEGHCHRVDGPAYIRYDDELEEYWVKGRQIPNDKVKTLIENLGIPESYHQWNDEYKMMFGFHFLIMVEEENNDR